MSILSLFLALILLGVIVWAINQFIPMAPGIKQVLNIAAVIFAVLIVASAFGVFSGLGSMRVPTIR
jgi:hypothetical protein